MPHEAISLFSGNIAPRNINYLVSSISCEPKAVALSVAVQRGIFPRLRMKPATAVSSLVHVTPQCHGIRDMFRYRRTRKMRCYHRHPTRSAPIQQNELPNVLHAG